MKCTLRMLLALDFIARVLVVYTYFAEHMLTTQAVHYVCI